MQQGTEIGAYEVIEQIGAGGMGEVWIAEHRALGRRAAIKVLRRELSGHGDLMTRFFNEARAAAAIRDPGIVQIFDFGHASDGSAYIVMELLEGEALDSRLARLGTIPLAEALRLMRQVASSLHAAHSRGIVHRDLKPGNVFVVRDSEVVGGERAKVLDFGIAKLADANGNKTKTATILGTPTYMSPEQCRGAGQVDARSDVYSLGCVLFHLITGRTPFEAEGAGELLVMHLREPPPLASSIASHVPSQVDALIARCLEKDPARRFTTTQLVGELAALCASCEIGKLGIQTAPVTLSNRPSPLPTTLSSMAMQVPHARKSSRWWIGTVAVVSLGVVSAFLVVRRSGEPSEISAVASPVDGAPLIQLPADAPLDVVPPPSELAVTAKRMAAVITAFAGWSKTHLDAACPSVGDLVSFEDGWGRAMQVTCTEQPPDRQIGVVSAGPDGEHGTADDVRSWQQDNVEAIRGPHWSPQALSPRPARLAPKPKPHPKPEAPNCTEQRC